MPQVGGSLEVSAMASSLNRLSAKKVAGETKPGRHSDGGGLYLRITPTGSRSWLFMDAKGGKRREIGLGSATRITLQAARKLASEMRDAIALGHDPRSVITAKAAIKAAVPTFGEVAEAHISQVESGWRNPVHRQQWRNSLRDHAKLIMDKPVDQITTEDVLAVLKPIWLTKAETAKRVRGRIETILNVAKTRNLRPQDSINPATFRGHLQLLLPKAPKLAHGHHAALPVEQAPAFMKDLRSRRATSARALEFTILTAARSGEVLGAIWGEIDFDKKLWTVPASRMKAGHEHVVPLSDDAVRVMEAIKSEDCRLDQRIFQVRGKASSNMAMSMLLRRMGRNDITTHGFRSTFRDWAGDMTDFPRELVEHALAHLVGSATERSYRRGQAVTKRRELMQQWADFLKAKDEVS